jgi:chromosome segregation ATPase
MSDKNVLTNNLRLVSIDLSNLTNQVRLLEEHIRRLQTGINDTVDRMTQADNLLERLSAELKRIRTDNAQIDAENSQLERDLQVLERHLELLEAQNGELEKELEQFVTSDEAIKQRLRSKTPPKRGTQAQPRDNPSAYGTIDGRGF